MEDDGDDKDDSKRRTRNMSEKKRRDQFNLLVNELSTMVSASNRKMDKSTVLKSTISFLKNHNEITVRSRAHDIQEDWKPAFLSNEEFTYLVLEALEGFVMVFSATGRIYYVSESITSLLGHNVVDVVNKSIFDLAYEEDRPNLYSLLQGSGSSVESIQRVGPDNEIRFQCHLRRGTLDFRDTTTYELIDFSGHFRTNTEEIDSDDLSYRPEHESKVLFVCTGRLYTPQLIRDVSLADSSRSEFTSRHSLEWKFLFLDHRAPPIIGYLPFEVLGTSGYDYYHFDDLEKVVNCHEELMEKGELTSCYYRFLTKGQQWIWLQTRYYITYHQWNSKPEFVVCTHRVVNYSDVSKSGKQETADADMDGEEAPTQPSASMKDATEESMSAMSPTYMSDASEAFAMSYQSMAQPVSTSKMCTLSVTAPAPSVSWSRSCGRYTPGSDCASFRYAPSSDIASIRYAAGSDTASLSGESRSSQMTNSQISNSREKRIHSYGSDGIGHGSMMTFQLPKSEPALVPQQAIGAQYLEPVPYVNAVRAVGAVGAVAPLGAVATVAPLGVGSVASLGAVSSVGALGSLSIPTLPVIVTPDQAQTQEQLQQKHEELQQMIVRQQEELRLVKEQLLLARLGILPPLPAVSQSYMTDDIQHMSRTQAEIMYEEPSGRSLITNYPPQQPPHHPHLPQ
ncbi:circadian locomoter output cycles kaput protein Clock isoform X2 [Choristoneura fumiferana]|uniref:circadian locomoter output cycles kaput protein Clock isoform X2 n=1 Tax=Choristoneura fumiferana TaxID=7141 RepID=UPI003D154213